MLDNSKNKTIKRIAVYSAMTITVFTLSTVLIFVMLGYRYNQNSNTIIQGGLVQFISQPTGAKVRVSDVDLANPTRSKITLNPGKYRIKMTLAGYRDWVKDTTVKAGTVLWLNSAHLVPSDPETSSVLDLPTLGSVAMQEDGRRITLLREPAKPVITLITANDQTVTPKTITLPESSYTAGTAHVFSLLKQSGDNRHVLLKHSYDDKVEWMVVDIDAVDKTYVIAADKGTAIDDVQFDPSSNDRMFVRYGDGTIRRIDVSSGERSEPLVKNAADFTLTSRGTLLYATKSTEGTVETGFISEGKQTPRVLQSYKTTTPVHIAAGSYYDNFYLVTSQDSATTLRVYSDFPGSDETGPIVADKTSIIVTPESVRSLSFKANGRLIALQQARTQTVYDLDLGTKSDVAIQGIKNDLTKPLQWLDSFHFWNDATGTLRQYESDGSNQEQITTIAAGFPAAYSQNQKYLYSIGKTEKGFRLQRTLMILN